MGNTVKGIHEHSRNMIRYVESNILTVDLKCDKYLETATPRQKYVFDTLLKVPLLYVIHQWLLLCPYSNYWFLEVLLFVVRYGVAFLLIGTVGYNAGVLLHLYTTLTVDSMAVWMMKIKYWTHQDDAYEVSHEKDVFVWSDITESWWIPVVLSIMLQNIYLSCRVWYVVYKEKEDFGLWIYIIPLASLLPDILSIFGVFPAVLSEISYWLSALLVIALCFHEVFLASTELEEDMNERKLNVLKTKAKLVYDEQLRLKYQSQIEVMEQRIANRSKRMNYADRFQGKWFVRDAFIAFGIPYLSMAVLVEVLIYQRSISTLFTFSSVLEITTSWCTSQIVVMVVLYVFSLMSNLSVALCAYLLTTEINLVEALDANIGTLVQTTSFIAFAETNMLSLDYTEKQEAMKIVIFLSIYTLFIQTMENVRLKVLNIVNSGSPQGITLHVRFWILTVFLVSAPTYLTYYVAKTLNLELPMLFFASGNCILVVNMFYMMAEYLVATLTWYTIDYLSTLDSMLHCLNMSRGFYRFLMIGLQSYYRYMFPLFKSSWTLRFSIEVFCVVSVAYYIGTIELKSYRRRNQMFTLLNNLPDVRFDEEVKEEENNDDEAHECSICFSAITAGKALPCAHAFHKDCLQRWFQVKFVCPFCNTAINFNNQTDGTSNE